MLFEGIFTAMHELQKRFGQIATLTVAPNLHVEHQEYILRVTLFIQNTMDETVEVCVESPINTESKSDVDTSLWVNHVIEELERTMASAEFKAKIQDTLKH